MLAEIDYRTFKDAQPELRTRGIYRGIGIAQYVEGTGIPPYEGVEVTVESTGFVYVSTGYPSQGQGHQTTLIQIVASELGVDPEKIVVHAGRTDKFAWGVGTLASRAAVIGGTAAILASRKVRKRALEMAADKLEVSTEDLDITSGRVHVKGAEGLFIELKTLADLANPIITLEPGVEPGLRAVSYHRPEGGTFASGSHGMIVDIDIATGQVEIGRYVVVHDCGVMINPMLVEGQVAGGVAQGIGGSFYERLVFSPEGQLLTTTFADYLLPSSLEIPPIEIHHLDHPSSLNPGGFKGVGEGGVTPSMAVFANAVEDALEPFGVRVRAIPLDPPKILELIRSAGKR